MKTLLKRFSEPSTYAGLTGMAVIAGMSAEEFQQIANAIAGVFAFLAVAVGEKEK